jgi:hypothetical protein
VAIENGDVTSSNPPSQDRMDLWRRAAIRVQGQPNWVFIKLHCHGMDAKDEAAMLGPVMVNFLQDLTALRQSDTRIHTHFVTAREIVNIILAGCDGRSGNPNEYRNYKLRLPTG